jgi:hypothetical protein
MCAGMGEPADEVIAYLDPDCKQLHVAAHENALLDIDVFGAELSVC